MNFYADARADVVHPLVRFTLYAYTIDAVLFTREKYSGEALADLGDIRRKFRPFADDRSIDILNLPAIFANFGYNGFKKFCRICPAPLLICIGKVRSDIAESRRAEKRIDYRMDEDIRVGMSL